MYNKKILSMLLSTVMTVSLTGVPTANAENSSAPTKANALSDEAAPQETAPSEEGGEIIAHCMMCHKGLTQAERLVAPNGVELCADCYDEGAADKVTMGEFTDTVAEINDGEIIFAGEKRPFKGSGYFINYFEDDPLKVGDTIKFSCAMREGQKAYYVQDIISAEKVKSDAPSETTAPEKTEYPVITHRELYNGLVSTPSKIIYSKDEFNYDNLDLSGMTISVNDVTETRTNAYSGYSTTTPVEYKIGKVYSDMYRYEAGWYIASLTYDDETGKYSDVNYPGIPNKYTVRFTDAGDVLRFSEPDTPDVIHEVENAYELKFDIYIDDPDDKNEFIRIDNKEVTGYAFGRTLKIKDIGDFTTDMDTYAYVNYYIDQNIHAGDIVSGVLCVDPERKYVICGDLEVVKPAPGNGDANCDNSVDMSDVVLIMQFLANPDKYGIEGTDPNHITNSGLRNADQNGDGVTVEDALILQKKLLGLE